MASASVAKLEAWNKVGQLVSSYLTTGTEADMGKEKRSGEDDGEDLEEDVFVVDKLLDMKWKGKKQFFLVRRVLARGLWQYL